MDLLLQIRKALPYLAPDMAEDVIQDVAILVLEGDIDADDMAAGIAKHLPSLKRKYPSAQFQLSLDQPISNAEGVTATLGDLIYKSGTLPKRRGGWKRKKNVRPMVSAVCKQCRERFYYKKPGRKLKPKESQRVQFLEEIDPQFWTKLDITLLRIANPDLLNKHRKIVGRTAKAGNFCSIHCAQKYACVQPKKLPMWEVLAEELKTMTTAEIADKYGVWKSHVDRLLTSKGLRDKKWQKGDLCRESGCNKPRHKTLHSTNGTMYGTRCLFHRKLYYAEKSREAHRKKNNVPQENWRVLDSKQPSHHPEATQR